MRKTTLQLKKVKVNKRTYWQLTKPKPGGHVIVASNHTLECLQF